MDRNQPIDVQIDSLKKLLSTQLGLRRGSLARRVAKAGRRLPTGVRNDIAHLAEVETMMQHPKTAMRLDPASTHVVYERAAAFLRGIDVADRRKGLILSILGSIAFNILAVITILIVVLRWRGLI